MELYQIGQITTDSKFYYMLLHKDKILNHTLINNKRDTARLLNMDYTQFTQWIRHTKYLSSYDIDISTLENNITKTIVIPDNLYSLTLPTITEGN